MKAEGALSQQSAVLLMIGDYNEEITEPSGMPGRNWSVLLYPWRVFPANKIRFRIVILEANLKIYN